MRKTVWTGLMLSMAIKSVFACSYASDAVVEPSLSVQYPTLFLAFFGGTFVLALPLGWLFFQRRNRNYWGLAATISLAVFYLPAIFIADAIKLCRLTMVDRVTAGGFFMMLLIAVLALVVTVRNRVRIG